MIGDCLDGHPSGKLQDVSLEVLGIPFLGFGKGNVGLSNNTTFWAPDSLNWNPEPYRLGPDWNSTEKSMDHTPAGNLFGPTNWTTNCLWFGDNVESDSTTGKFRSFVGMVVDTEAMIQKACGHAALLSFVDGDN
jgi:hypothetical protein